MGSYKCHIWKILSHLMGMQGGVNYMELPVLRGVGKELIHICWRPSQVDKVGDGRGYILGEKLVPTCDDLKSPKCF